MVVTAAVSALSASSVRDAVVARVLELLLNVGFNELTSLAALAPCVLLQSLNVMHNKLRSLQGLEALGALPKLQNVQAVFCARDRTRQARPGRSPRGQPSARPQPRGQPERAVGRTPAPPCPPQELDGISDAEVAARAALLAEWMGEGRGGPRREIPERLAVALIELHDADELSFDDLQLKLMRAIHVGQTVYKPLATGQGPSLQPRLQRKRRLSGAVQRLRGTSTSKGWFTWLTTTMTWASSSRHGVNGGLAPDPQGVLVELGARR